MTLKLDKPTNNNIMRKYILLTILLSISTLSCSDYKHIDESKFIGKWALFGREIYSGMEISITKENNLLVGKINKTPNNKYGDIFLKTGDIWISSIKRSANHYFKITEFKIASEIFALYDLSTTNDYYATFSEDYNTIYLSKKTPNITQKKTRIYFKKISQ